MKSKLFHTLADTVFTLPLTPLLLLNAVLMMAPKLALIYFVNLHLWGEITAQNLPGAIAQDLLIALAVLFSTALLLQKPSRLRLAAGFLLGGALLLLLMIDMRVRELWLKPFDLSIIHYGLANLSDLTSGIDLFFNQSILPWMTYRKFLFFIGVVYIGNWGLIAGIASSGKSIQFRQPRILSFIFVASAAILLFLAVSAPQYRYRMNENVVTGYLVSRFQASFTESSAQTENSADRFEQPQAPLASQQILKRQILNNVKPFRNVVVVIYESMRWKDINILGEGTTLSPVLAKMASSGIVSKSYVTVPHSSKAYYAVLTGRHPYLGIEMREVLQEQNASLWHYLHTTRHMNNYAFSSLFLGFEGMGKLLKSFGIEPYETRELARKKGIDIASASSFGTSDEYLYTLGSQSISKTGDPFSAIFFPIAAHYPYECKGSDPKRHNLDDYEKCVAESDTNLAKLLDEFRQRGLMQDTLFVVVGDHGESFGEHGLFVHNSSMYNEEVTVPLIFWSEDGRLGQHRIPYSRQIDIAPTIADLMGAMEANIPVQGVSLLRQANQNPPVFMATFFDGLGSALFEPPYKYILESSTNRLTTFDLTNDPFEKSPVDIPEEKKRDVIARIRTFYAYQERAFSVR